MNLGTSNDLLTKYQQVLPEHLSTEKEITEENRYGQGTHVLPWFWRVGGVGVGWGLGQGLVPNGWMNVSAWHLSRCAHDNFLSI